MDPYPVFLALDPDPVFLAVNPDPVFLFMFTGLNLLRDLYINQSFYPNVSHSDKILYLLVSTKRPPPAIVKKSERTREIDMDTSNV